MGCVRWLGLERMHRSWSAVLLLLAGGTWGCDDKVAIDPSTFATGGADGQTGGSPIGSQPDASGGQLGTGGATMDSGGSLVDSTGGEASGGSDAGMEMGGDGAGGKVADGPRGTGAGDWEAGDYPPDLVAESYLEIAGLPNQAGLTRQYKVHVPPTYDPTQPTPLVYCLHGLSQTPVMFCINGAKMVDTSDQEGFILVMPKGDENSWNGGSCCGGAAAKGLDEVGFMRAIFDEVSSHLNVDLDRVFATGLSNGGYMSYRLACEAADLFAAVAPAAGLIGLPDVYGTNPADSDLVDCQPSRPIPIFDTHGDADGIVPFMSKADTLEVVRGFDGCSASTVPATDPVSAGDTTCVTYEGCDADVEVTACTVAGGGHCWFGSEDCGTGGGAIGAAVVGAGSDTLRNNEAVWRFFERNPMPR